ncbi:MAG: hypothetical protein Q9226_007715 [Calogaya cf. arnoldii]
MWTLHLPVLLLISTRFILSAEADCSSELLPPLAIPIRNISLPNLLLRRGLALSFGTPSQALALDVSADWDNTYIFDGASPCDVDRTTSTAIQCSAKRGGLLDEGGSTTWKQFSNLTAAGAARERKEDTSKNTFGTDSVKINSTFSLEKFPFGVIRNGPQVFNVLGLGRNSTFINRLLSVGAIASKTWGLAVGWQGALSEHQTDGSLVLGGYDAALTNGSNFTYPFTVGTGCSLTVTISDIVLNLKNGSSASILPPSRGTAIQACLSPFAPWISISEDIFKTFLNVTGFPEKLEPGRSLGVNFWGMLFKSEDVYARPILFS